MPINQKWTWAAKLDPNNVTTEHLYQAYNLQFDNLCKIDSCRRNCKKVLCIACFDKSWIDNDNTKESIELMEECNGIEQQRSDIKSFVGLKNLGATCYVNCLLQLWFHNPALRKAIYLWEKEDSFISNNSTNCNQKIPNSLAVACVENDVDKHTKSSNDQPKSSPSNNLLITCKTNEAEDLQSAAVKKLVAIVDEKLQNIDTTSNSIITRSSLSPVKNKDSQAKPQSNPIQELQLIFARLQFSNKKSIDPYNFIDSLNLNATEQQDAQEFGNLFIEFLEKSFANQRNNFVANVIRNQFCGRYSYATICSNCNHSSLSDSKFYELDLSIQKMETLNDCLNEYFRPVELDGKYNCSNCQKSSKAERKIILNSLPPTLNLQLLRFVYDVQRNSRQKLNSYIIFPERLDMTPYLNKSKSETASNKSSISNGSSQSHIYTLTAVLIHRGSSPHSGHYIAHIKDRISKDWFKFNDDVVERIGPELNVTTDGESVIVVDNDTKISTMRQDDSKGMKLKLTKTTNLKSKTAYMLVYQALDSNALSYPTDYSQDWDLPTHLQTAVVEENSKCDEMFENFRMAREVCRSMMQERRNQIRSIYKELVVTSSDDEFEFIDKKWLQDWLTNSYTDVKFLPICNKKFLCCHNKLDLKKIDQVKCIRTKGADMLYKEFDGGPRLKDALCKECVEVEVRHYQLRERMKEEQKFITSQAKFKIDSESFDECYCVGKNSYRDWQRLVMRQFIHDYPNFRKSNKNNHDSNELENGNESKISRNSNDSSSDSDDDESFDSFQFNSDLLCEHNRLTQDISDWRIVPSSVWNIFKRYFGSNGQKLIEFTAAEFTCPDCKAEEIKMIEIGDVKKQLASVIKSKLMDLFHNRKRSTWTTMLRGDKYYAIDKSFFTQWQKFLRNPCNQSEPKLINIRDKLLCAHDKSIFYHGNSNPNQGDCPFILVSKKEWSILREHYECDGELSFFIDEDLAEAKKLLTFGSKISDNNQNSTAEKENSAGHNQMQLMEVDTKHLNEQDIELEIDWSDCIVSDPGYCSECHEIFKQLELNKLLNYETAVIYVTKTESPVASKSKVNHCNGHETNVANELTNGYATVVSSNNVEATNLNSIEVWNANGISHPLDQQQGDTNDDDSACVVGKRRRKIDIEDEANEFVPPGGRQNLTPPPSSSPNPSNLRRTTRRNRNREQAYTIKPQQTLLELKKEIFSRCQVLPMDQRLFLNDILLDDNSKTMSDLKMLPNSSLKLEVDKPIADTIDLIEEDTQTRKSSSALPETGFKGSLLLSNSHF